MDIDITREIKKIEQVLGFYCGRIASMPLVPPDHVYFSLTNRCNLRCRMCDISKSPTSIEEELTTVKIKDIIMQIKAMGIKHLIFSGGEPLLREDIVELIGFAAGQGIGMVGMITNGTLLNSELIHKLVEAGLTHMTVSLDGLNDTNDAVRGLGSFDKALKAIDELNQYKESIGTALPTIGINFTIMGTNLGDIVPMVEFARQKRCNVLIFQPVLFNNTKMRQSRQNDLWPDRSAGCSLDKIMKKILELKKASRDLYIGTEEELLDAFSDHFMKIDHKRHFKCYEGIKRIVITYNGKLWSCSGIYGDLNQGSLESHWYSDNARRMRAASAACRKHCLQDCVYMPADIVALTKDFIKKIEVMEAGEKVSVKRNLAAGLDSHMESIQLSLKDTNWFFKFHIRNGLNKELKKLSLLKKIIINN